MFPTLLVVVIAAAAMVGLVCAVLRIVPHYHCAVVTRAGRVRRTRPAGLVAVLPLVERVAILPLQAMPLDARGFTALTRDAVEVRLVVNVLWCIADPVLAVQARPDVRTATADAVDRALRQLVATVDLVALLRQRESFLERLPVTALPLVGPIGVGVVDVDLVDVELRVGPQLLRMLG